MVADFHHRGVKVLFPLMAWDQGTRDAGMTDWDATAKLMMKVEADGVNGDTLRGIPRVNFLEMSPSWVVVFSLEYALKRSPVVRAKRKCVFPTSGAAVPWFGTRDRNKTNSKPSFEQRTNSGSSANLGSQFALFRAG